MTRHCALFGCHTRLLQYPTPDGAVGRFLAGDLKVELALLETVDLIGSEIEGAAYGSLGCFGYRQIEECGTAHTGRNTFVNLCCNGRTGQAVERCIDRQLGSFECCRTAARTADQFIS